jgi:hypothetical protein
VVLEDLTELLNFDEAIPGVDAVVACEIDWSNRRLRNSSKFRFIFPPIFQSIFLSTVTGPYGLVACRPPVASMAATKRRLERSFRDPSV